MTSLAGLTAEVDRRLNTHNESYSLTVVPLKTLTLTFFPSHPTLWQRGHIKRDTLPVASLCRMHHRACSRLQWIREPVSHSDMVVAVGVHMH